MIDILSFDNISKLPPASIDARVNLDCLASAMPNVDAASVGYFHSPSGSEHYKFLAYVSCLLANSIIIDIGTHKGLSAAALSYNRTNTVISFDIANSLEVTPEALPNAHFMLKNALEPGCDQNFFVSMCRHAGLILLDVDPHDGQKEVEFMDLIRASGFRGPVLFDDIHLNAPMQGFWDALACTKIDLTRQGHFSGTGAAFL
ncbi:hypothetical protein [Azospirillum sp. sgz301742]